MSEAEAADTVGLDVDDLVERVGAHTAYDPMERETSITFAEDRHTASVHTLERGITGRLLRHPEVCVEDVYVRTGDGMTGCCPARLPEEHPHARIVGLRGRIPVGILKLQLQSRRTTSHADVVTEQVLTNGRTEL